MTILMLTMLGTFAGVVLGFIGGIWLAYQIGLKDA